MTQREKVWTDASSFRAQEISPCFPHLVCAQCFLLRPAVLFFFAAGKVHAGTLSKSKVPTAPPLPAAHHHCTLPVQGRGRQKGLEVIPVRIKLIFFLRQDNNMKEI